MKHLAYSFASCCLFLTTVVSVRAEVQSLTFWCGDYCYVRNCSQGQCTRTARIGTCLPGQSGTFNGQLIDMELLGITTFIASPVSGNNFQKRYLIIGSNNADYIVGWDYDDRICGRDGDDVIKGNIGHDYLNGNQGTDEIHGGKFNDCIRGGKGNDIIYGDIGYDTLYGDGGYDILYGGDDTDTCIESEGPTSTCESSSPSSNDVCLNFTAN